MLGCPDLFGGGGTEEEGIMKLGLASGIVVFLETLFCGPVNICVCQLGGGRALDLAQGQPHLYGMFPFKIRKAMFISLGT